MRSGRERVPDAVPEEGAVASTPVAKRVVDVVLSAAGLLLSAPVWPVAALAVKAEDGGSVLYTHRRIGKGGRVFTAWKFRSLVPGNSLPPGEGRPDPDQVTRVGSLLRTTALDELPQLLNILRGDMSFVGPRPLMPEQVERERREGFELARLPGFRERHGVLPGLTGLAQVRGPWKLSYRRKFRYDRFYVRHRSLGLDLLLIVRSVALSAVGLWPSHEEEVDAP